MLSPTELEAGRTDSRFLAWRKQMNVIFFAFVGGTAIYAGLSIAGVMPPKGMDLSDGPKMHFSIVLGIAAATLAPSGIVGAGLRKQFEPKILNEPFQKAIETTSGYVIARLAFAEAVAIYGFVSPFMISRKDFMLPLIAVGAVAVVITYRLVMPWAETMLLTRIARERLSGQ